MSDSKKTLAVFAEKSDWVTEMNLISGPGRDEYVDIRQRKKDGSMEGRGVTLTLDELRKLVTAYIEWEEEGGCLAKVSVIKGPETQKLRILQRLAVLGRTKDEWNKELNITSFNERAPMFDVREWHPEHPKRRIGKTFTESDMDTIAFAFEEHFGPVPHKKEHWWE